MCDLRHSEWCPWTLQHSKDADNTKPVFILEVVYMEVSQFDDKHIK